MCIFCDIVSGSIPSVKINENDEFIAILDISQTTKGHTLIIPKKHSDNFLQMDKDEFVKLMGFAQETAKMIFPKLNAKGMNVLINTNEVAGQTVMHTHVHLIPRYDENDTVSFAFSENQFDLEEIAGLIK